MLVRSIFIVCYPNFTSLLHDATHFREHQNYIAVVIVTCILFI